MKEKLDYEIIDNFLTEKSHKKIFETLNSNLFPWYLQNEINEFDNNSIHSRYFTHTFFDNDKPNSDFFNLWEELVEKIHFKKLIRLKANLYLSTYRVIEHAKHMDYDFESTTALYYVNTNNGYTNLNDEIKIESISNRFLKFNNNILHNSTTCSDEKIRLSVVINYV
jgi:hypothetical protein